MSPCLNYITGNSSTPSSSCCTQLANVYVKSLIVLPPHSGSGQSLMGVNIVQTRALALPGACTVQTPSIGRCNASSPTDSPSGTPNSPPAVPSTDNGTSDANSTKYEESPCTCKYVAISDHRQIPNYRIDHVSVNLSRNLSNKAPNPIGSQSDSYCIAVISTAKNQR
ncbi:non-specific lipid-transfer protein [Salix suchowensis]|nr:non-specific lipid-transfer protein [Salix suchowensis]